MLRIVIVSSISSCSKAPGVFSSNCRKPASSPVLYFHRAGPRDSSPVITPFVRVWTSFEFDILTALVRTSFPAFLRALDYIFISRTWTSDVQVTRVGVLPTKLVGKSSFLSSVVTGLLIQIGSGDARGARVTRGVHMLPVKVAIRSPRWTTPSLVFITLCISALVICGRLSWTNLRDSSTRDS